jgi:putative acetyltransferase
VERADQVTLAGDSSARRTVILAAPRSRASPLILVAAGESGHVAAFIDLEPDGHIDRLFCAPEAAGRGVASRLYDAIEIPARAQGIERLFTEASELARRLFERKGFTVLERQDKILRDVPIHNYRMTKTLGFKEEISGDRPGRQSRQCGWVSNCQDL